MKAQIIIGLGFGDEGKGITTDWLCSQAKNPIVIRHSGGQQAGHTVIFKGKKHIHSNFGSGTLRGIPSYFSEFTTFYPTTILREKKRLAEKGVVNPVLVLHPLSKMTTPYDVFSNRTDNDNVEHGTCGLGIGKTMKRSESPYQLFAVDLLNKENLHRKIKIIAEQYYNTPTGLSLNQENELHDFYEALDTIDWKVENYDFLLDYTDLIFEGSQGIMLDMYHGIFPHVTYSHTTSKNAHAILDKIGCKSREMFYITRSYSTRHGADPYYEHQELNLVNNEEEINVDNKWQKEFKTAPINYSLLNYALKVDSAYCPKGVSNNLMVTCNDQMDGTLLHTHLGIKFDKVFHSFSPEGKDIKQL